MKPGARVTGKVSATRKAAKAAHALASKESRARQRAGLVLLRVVVPEVELALALIEAGMLPPSQEDDRKAIERAVEAMLRHFSEAA